MDRVLSFLLWPLRELSARATKTMKEKRGSITCRTDQANEANKMSRNEFDVLTEFEVRTGTYRPEIDQSQHAKSVSHITE